MRSPLVRLPEVLASAGYALREEQPADDPFLIALYRTTREPELAQVEAWGEDQKQAFVLMQFNAQRVHYRNALKDVSFDVIELNGEPAGRLYMQERQETLHIIDIILVPSLRGQGLGGILIEALAANAAVVGKPLSIFVEMFNPARRLYDRLGFVPLGEQGHYVEMERPLAADVAATRGEVN